MLYSPFLLFRFYLCRLFERRRQTNGNRSKQWTSNITRPASSSHQSAQRSYERYLALAQGRVQAGDMVQAENYYQHAEHHFRSLFERETK
jgi:hypothetical protein